MLKPSTCYVASACIALAWATTSVHAQEVLSDDAVIDGIRGRSDIGLSDQRRIAAWVDGEIEKFTEFLPFRKRFDQQFNDAKNSEQFRVQLATQTAQVAAQQFVNPDLSGDVAHALAQVLTDMNRRETFPGFIAGLKSSDVRARYFCAKGLIALQDWIAGDKARLDQTVQALREAGLGETDPVVLGRFMRLWRSPAKLRTSLTSTWRSLTNASRHAAARPLLRTVRKTTPMSSSVRAECWESSTPTRKRD